ncbi:MAG: hypothetical protein AAFS11_01320 [Planctomycetota bacterium]
MTDNAAPLFITRFAADHVTGFSLVGQKSAMFEFFPFDFVRLYQDHLGNPGELTFEIEIHRYF